MDSGFYSVIVKIEVDTGKVDKEGKTKYKKKTERYVVKGGCPEHAVKLAEKAMDGCPDSWRIDTVKEIQLDGILGLDE